MTVQIWIPSTASQTGREADRETDQVTPQVTIRIFFARIFALIFFALSAAMVISMVVTVVREVGNGAEMMQLLIKVVNTGIIALAVFELAMVVSKEYGSSIGGYDVMVMLRRTMPRFIGTVCIALSLEALIMVIKYSQLELAGNLYYPVAIIISTALLLAALGIFLKCTPEESSAAQTQHQTQHQTPQSP